MTIFSLLSKELKSWKITGNISRKNGKIPCLIDTKNLFFRCSFGKYYRSRNAGDFDFYLLPGLCIRYIHDIASHFHNPVTTFGNRLDLNVHDSAFLKVLGDRFSPGFSLSHGAVTTTSIATEQHNPVILHKACVRFTALRADHIILDITLHDHFKERDLKFSIKNGTVAVNFPGCAQLTEQKFHQVFRITTELAGNIGEVFKHRCLAFNIRLCFGNYETLRR